MNNSKRLLALAVSAALSAPMAAYATNGMNLDGYGPIAAGMGGASMAYDNGTAGMMNNPATIGMGGEGSRLDVAIGNLRPDVKTSIAPPYAPGAMSWESKSTSFLMPAIGWTKSDGKLTYGAGAFAQGGMGTEYGPTGPGSDFVAMGIMMASDDPTIVGGWKEFSEVGVMRILFPVSYQMNDKLNVGGSIDYVRAGMDLQMAMPMSVMGDMMMNPASTVGTITTDMMLPPTVYGGYFNFADDSDYTGAATGAGFAAKLGFTYQASPELTLGGTYHSKTSMSDLEGSGDMQVAYDDGGTGAVMAISGDYTVVNFEWPATIALGMAYQASDKLMVVADIKQIKWSEVMKDFSIRFDSAAGFMEATMYQNWDDQTVKQLGVAYSVNNATTVRAGVNLADNPVPASTLSYLFPATVENHVSFGVGHTLSSGSDINFSMTYAPSVSVMGSNATSNIGLEVEHSQTAYQLMYSKKF